jgi:hypothetical protein
LPIALVDTDSIAAWKIRCDVSNTSQYTSPKETSRKYGWAVWVVVEVKGDDDDNERERCVRQWGDI